jgi:quercetin dioxygenase-like cupin family protein
MLDPNKPAMPTYTFNVNGATINTFHVEKAGEGHPKHVHDYDHVTMVHSGKLLVTTHDTQFTMTKENKPILFPANQWHELEAIEDCTVFTNVFGENQEGQRNVSDM